MSGWIGGCIVAIVVGSAGLAFAYEAVDVVDGGVIEGTVTFKGDVPAPTKVAITKDPEVCGTEKVRTNLVVGPKKGIRDAVVRLQDIQRGKKPDAPTTVTLDQKGCEYTPHVLLFPAGSRVRIRNDDGILHNTNVTAEANRSFTVAQPKSRRVVEKRIDEPEMGIRVQCDVHAWMNAWWVSQEHPYYALTGADGSFTLTDVPAGDYTLAVWHESLGTVTRKVSVAPKGVAAVTIEMTKR
jgi:carboxypeptidase family protein